jgi:hypothetical protein
MEKLLQYGLISIGVYWEVFRLSIQGQSSTAKYCGIGLPDFFRSFILKINNTLILVRKLGVSMYINNFIKLVYTDLVTL